MPGLDLIEFKIGKIVHGRWKIHDKLGIGGCGSVFKVEDLRRKGFMAALKAETYADENNGVLKLEASLLKKLQGHPNMIRLFDSGRRKNYNYMVINLCGNDLFTLRSKTADNCLSDSTILRIGVQILYSLKQIHEVGYVHRDVKPGNIMNGLIGREQRIFYLIDYGMTRSFVLKDMRSIRRQRKDCLFRGTLRYCSLNVHLRVDQGRMDDIWSLLYSLTEVFAGLPWRDQKKEEDVRMMKQKMKDEEVFRDCPKSFLQIANHLRKLRYEDRPDYFAIYKMMMDELKENEFSFLDPYDWEKENADELVTALEFSEREKKFGKPLNQMEIVYRLFSNVAPKSFEKKSLVV